MKWFHHECAAKHDPKLQTLGAQHGAEGLGIFWGLLEEIGQHSDTFHVKISGISAIADRTFEEILQDESNAPAALGVGRPAIGSLPRFPLKILAKILFTSPQKLERVIHSTAPTGHTIRLLELPAEWSQSIDAASAGSGQTCLGPAAAIQDAKHKYERALAAMRQSEQTSFVFVLHPEAISIKETRRAIDELSKLEIHNSRLIVNGIIPPEGAQNPLFAARTEMQVRYLSQISAEFPYSTQRMTLQAGEIKGVERLRQVGKIFFDGEQATGTFEAQRIQSHDVTFASSLDDVRARIEPNGHRRTVFFAGKGGVGKTVASCVTAVWLARQGYKTLLLVYLQFGYGF